MKLLPRWNKTLAWKEIGPYFVIVDPVKNRQILSLNEVGKLIWTFCNGESTQESCLASLMNEYDIGKEEAICDLNTFIDELLKQGVLEYV